MLLSGDDKNKIELKVIGYQFPQLEHEEYDSDWLRIQIHVTHPRGTWISIDACLLTWETAGLANWLQAIANGQSVDEEESFMEPNLRFHLLDNNAKLRLYFELECRPSWAPSDGAGMDDLWVDLDVDPQQLLNAAESLRADLERFPVRVGVAANV